MHHSTRRRGGLLLLCAVLAACQDDPAARISAPGTDPQMQEEPAVDGHDLHSIPRFDVFVEAGGALRPGTPVRVTARARANFPTADAELRITLPEVEVLRRTGGEFRIPAGVTLPAAAERRAAVGRGGELTAAATVTLPGPGYYRVVASAVQRSDEPPLHEGRAVQGTVHREIWILVDERGGRVTDTFDESLLPEGALRAPGPLRLLPEHARGRRGEGAPRERSGTPEADGTVSAQSTGTLSWRFTYYNQDAFRYDPLAGADIEVTYWGYDDWWQPRAYSMQVYSTDSNGNFSHDCGGGYYDYWWDGPVLLRNQRVDVSPGSVSGVYGDYNWCQSAHYDVTVHSIRAHLFTSMSENMVRSTAHHGYSRPRVRVTADPNATNSFYQGGSTDRITMRTTSGDDHVWGSWGQFVMAHELGHAVHEKALNGNAAGGSCPSPHYLNGAHNLRCAYSEGFANYQAAVTRSVEIGYYYSYFQNNWGYPGQTYSGTTPTGTSTDGSIIESSVAAFFLDLVDSDSESHDNTAYPGSYVANVIRTCEAYQYINFWTGSSWIRANGVDHLIYCFENQLDSNVVNNYFTTRSPKPTNQREFAAEPFGLWNRWDIRANWLMNLYGQ